MKYRLTAVTPLLVGDGQRLSPIDYMVWKDQINVLDQYRIFRLLSKGPRLDGYLTQLRKVDKLDFASWGGFAQNYAERRIPFEHPSSTPVWEQTRAEFLHIPTFAAGPRGPFLPASALKGALRTALAQTRCNPGVIHELAVRAEGERGLRRPGEAAESMMFGSSGNDPMRSVMAGDSEPVQPGLFRIYLVRVATLGDRLGWKPNPVFAEMAPARTAFTGAWKVTSKGAGTLFQAANEHAGKLLEIHREYAGRAGLQRVSSSLDALTSLLEDLRSRRDACLLNLGWAGGFLSKAAFLDTANEEYRKLLRVSPFFERAIRTGLPFPKTRRVVYEKGEPSTLPGWAMLEVA